MPIMTSAREWYRIRAEADAELAEIWIYDAIGESWFGGVSAKQFLDQIQALPTSTKTIRVHVNSPGGDVFDAVAIANLLRSESRDKKRTVEMSIEGLAASAASIITSAGDAIKIASNAMMMIHNPQGMVLGQAADMRAMAEALDSVRDSIVATYRWVSPLPAEELRALMEATTWMSAEEALEKGFVTEIMEPARVDACFRPEIIASLGTIPEPYRERLAPLTGVAESGPLQVDSQLPSGPTDLPAAESAASPAEIVALGKRLNLSLADVDRLISATAPTAERKLSLAEATARAQAMREIRGLCAAAKLPDFADGYIAAGLSVIEVQRQLTITTARMDAVEIVTALPADGDRPPRPASRLNPSAIYAERNARVGQRGV